MTPVLRADVVAFVPEQHIVTKVYARRGLVCGIYSPVPEDSRPSCGVFGSAWPSWALAAYALNFNLKFICVSDPSWLSLLRVLLPAVPVCLTSEFNPGLLLGLHLVLVDCRLNKGHPVWNTNTSTVVCALKSCSTPAHWQCSTLRLDHRSTGGVTTGAWFGNCYHQGPNLALLPLPVTALRDMSVVVDPAASSGVPCAAPTLDLDVRRPVCMELRPHVYHGSGLYPHSDPHPQFIVRSVFTSTGWCRRKLTPIEYLHVMDTSSEVLRLSTPTQLGLLRTVVMVPQKVLIGFLHSFSVYWSGGGSDELAACAAGSNELVAGENAAVSGSAHGNPVTGSAQGNLNKRVSETKSVSGSAQGNLNKRILETKSPDPRKRSRISSTAELSRVEASREVRRGKATKADDAEIPSYLWNERLRAGLIKRDAKASDDVLDVLRSLFLQWWKQNLRRSFWKWFWLEKLAKPVFQARKFVRWDKSSSSYCWLAQGHQGYKTVHRYSESDQKDLAAAGDGIARAQASTWWEWRAGSRPFFWRWDADYRGHIRDGIPLCLLSTPTQYRVPQSAAPNPVNKVLMKQKLELVLERGYIETGEVVSLTRFFSVPKGEADIRMVYDGTKSGLNQVLWVPWFPMPTIETHLRSVEAGTFMADVDIGEMFLNFVLHENIRKFCGVDLTLYFGEERFNKMGQRMWMRWGRCGMGFRSSPYQAVQGILWAEEMIFGNPTDATNVFRFDSVILNLPGCSSYEPARPWVYKFRRTDGVIACDLFIYVDDLRPTGPSEPECWAAARKAAAVCNFLGIQDAARKRREPSQEPGAWAGSILHTSNGSVVVLLSNEKWGKLKDILLWLHDAIRLDSGIPYKLLESKLGFLIYASRTYPMMTPYLKGLHLTLNSWRPWREEDGWKMRDREILLIKEQGQFAMEPGEGKPPLVVHPVARLSEDVEALMHLSSGEDPPLRRVRMSKQATAVYAFGDASGTGFGSAFWIQDKIHYRHGNWTVEIEDESSNFRELANLIFAIEEAYEAGLLSETELFLFTDNTTAESAYFRGSSSSRSLFDLVLKLRKLQMHGDFLLHVIHVAGTRMISQGADGLSRGDTSEGVMRGVPMLSFVPLHLSVLDRSPSLSNWVKSWWVDAPLLFTQPMDWYTSVHAQGNFLWAPPPAAAEAAIEQLGKARHKRPSATHIVLVPRLMTARWRKQLSKNADCLFTLPLGTDMWGNEQHEPLIVAFCLPLISFRPWSLRGTKLVVDLERGLREVSPSTPAWGRNLLCEFFRVTRSLETLPECLVRPLLQPTS